MRAVVPVRAQELQPCEPMQMSNEIGAKGVKRQLGEP